MTLLAFSTGLWIFLLFWGSVNSDLKTIKEISNSKDFWEKYFERGGVALFCYTFLIWTGLVKEHAYLVVLTVGFWGLLILFGRMVSCSKGYQGTYTWKSFWSEVFQIGGKAFFYSTAVLFGVYLCLKFGFSPK